jgi:hypothetical protein
MDDATDYVTRERYDALADELAASKREAERLARRLLEAQHKLNSIAEKIRGRMREEA